MAAFIRHSQMDWSLEKTALEKSAPKQADTTPSQESIQQLDDLLRKLDTLLSQNQKSLTPAFIQKRWRLIGQSETIEWVKPRKRPSDKLEQRRQKLLELQSIEPCEVVEAILKNCKANIESFIETHHRTSISRAISSRYVQLRKDEENQAISIIKRRFILQSLYLGTVEQGWHDGTSWCRHGKNRLSKIIHDSPDVHEDLKAICTNLEQYVSLGYGFYTWSTKLGGSGYLFLLLEAVSARIKLDKG